VIGVDHRQVGCGLGLPVKRGGGAEGATVFVETYR
jgi:hypothetical protein